MVQKADSKDLIHNFSEAVAAEINTIDQHLLPLLRTYLENVRGVRMAITHETNLIVTSSREMGKVGLHVDNLQAFIKSLTQLLELLTPENVERLKAVLK